jgi:hypothetical protein
MSNNTTAILLQKILTMTDAHRAELEKTIELNPAETGDQLLNLRSLLHSFTSHGDAIRSALREFE